MEAGEELLKLMPEGISLRSSKSPAGECPQCGHSPYGLEMLQSGSGRRTSKAHARGHFAKKF